MKTSIDLELEMEVDFDYQPAERMTHNDTGCPEDIEINAFKIYGCKINEKLFDKIMEDHGQSIEQQCWDQVEDDETQRQVTKAEYRQDAREDR